MHMNSVRPIIPSLNTHYVAPIPHASVTTTHTSFYDQACYLDSGFTHHVTPNASNIMESISLPRFHHVDVGNGQGFSITSLPLKFWDYALILTTYLINILQYPS